MPRYFIIIALFFFVIKGYSNNQASKNENKDQLLIEVYEGATYKKITPLAISMVLNDSFNLIYKHGLIIKIKSNDNYLTPDKYNFTIAADNELSIPKKNIQLKEVNKGQVLFIEPIALGYNNIILQASTNISSTSIVIEVAVSENTLAIQPIFWHTGMADGSNSIDLNDSTFITADDEQNEIRIYNRYTSGGPKKIFEYSKFLQLTDCKNSICSECDIESATKSIEKPNRIYWLGSMSNGKAPKSNSKPNRNRLFATDIINNDSIIFIGFYDKLKEAIVRFGNQNGYQLSNSAMEGTNPKDADGFNIEGMCFSPDNSTLFVACRAPLVPIKNRKKALIIPIINFETWFNNGQPNSEPSFAPPIELDLKTRGIRDIIKLSNNKLLIAAGNCDGELHAALYVWDGIGTNLPKLLPDFNLTNLNVEGLMEIKGNDGIHKIQVICDDGKQVYYNDGIEAKDLNQQAFKKFTSIIITSKNAIQ
jgi:archaellin